MLKEYDLLRNKRLLETNETKLANVHSAIFTSQSGSVGCASYSFGLNCFTKFERQISILEIHWPLSAVIKSAIHGISSPIVDFMLFAQK